MFQPNKIELKYKIGEYVKNISKDPNDVYIIKEIDLMEADKDPYLIQNINNLSDLDWSEEIYIMRLNDKEISQLKYNL